MKISHQRPPIGLPTGNVSNAKCDRIVAESVGKEHSPAHRARALIAQNPALQDRPFGKIVSALAHGEIVQGAVGENAESAASTGAAGTPADDSAPDASETIPPLDVTA